MTGSRWLRPENVDTDLITPIGRVLQGREAVERFAFEPLRFAADGNRLSSDPFPDPERVGAQILVAGRNFGCGSSRETAAWAVRGLGLRVIIAPSYGDIFYSNCLKSGVLAVGLSVDDTGLIAHAAEKLLEIEVDLPRQVLRCTNRNFHFEIEPVQKEMLLSGLDEIGVMHLSGQNSTNVTVSLGPG